MIDLIVPVSLESVTDIQTDGPTNQRTHPFIVEGLRVEKDGRTSSILMSLRGLVRSLVRLSVQWSFRLSVLIFSNNNNASSF